MDGECLSVQTEHGPRVAHVGLCRRSHQAEDAPPAPLVAGAISRGLDDARQSYRQQLDQLWRDVVQALPDD